MGREEPGLWVMGTQSVTCESRDPDDCVVAYPDWYVYTFYRIVRTMHPPHPHVGDGAALLKVCTASAGSACTVRSLGRSSTVKP